ncbi:hypothetical protein AVEN_157730-1 [Araneus ventricosus]|uniref:Uncharacterized protein n=1 Tax=Araneus ventricosus TaxID=182803 RepID=A0A4Y2HB83_ARAVE|nr:hypothetical protein AVEN_157730-1 [Araneus ventricosus]
MSLIANGKLFFRGQTSACWRYKPANSFALHSVHLSQHWFSSPIQVEKSGVHSSEFPKCAGSSGDLLSPLQLLFSPNYSFPTPAWWLLPSIDLFKSIEAPTTLAKEVLPRFGARTAGIWFGWKSEVGREGMPARMMFFIVSTAVQKSKLLLQ